MTTRTTIAELLAQVFAKLEQSIPVNTNHGPTLLQAWTAALGAQTNDALSVVRSIGEISAMMLKLEKQILESRKLRDHNRRWALQTLSGFKVLFHVERFNENSIAFRNACEEVNRGGLSTIGLSLEPEFSEPKLEPLDAQELVVELKEIKDVLLNSKIEISLRVSLSRYLDTMIWWLSEPDITSVQAIFETSGAALLVAKQIQDREQNHLPMKKRVAYTYLKRH